MHRLSSLFNAKSVAIIGASPSAGKTGHILLKNLIEGGYSGDIYPVNPKGGEILGLKACSSVLELPGRVDLAVVAIPAPLVPKALDEAGEMGIGSAIVISGGFAESGQEDLETALKEIARRHSISLIGPNCQGINYTPNSMCATWPVLNAKGSMAVVSQSGTVAATLGMWASEDGIGFSALVSLGNECDVTETDVLEFLSEDHNTTSIAMYVEGIKGGRRFLDVARKVTSNKPLVVLRPGRTERGQKAAQTHTRSLSGSYEVFHSVLRQIGALSADSIEELYDSAKALSFLKPLRKRNVLIVTSSGGSGILATDVLETCGLEVSPIPNGLREELEMKLPPQCIAKNPLDLTGDADSKRYETALDLCLNHPDIGSFLLIFGDPIPGAAEVVAKASSVTDKPIVTCFLGGGDVERDEIRKLRARGIPVYNTPERAAAALSVVSDSIRGGRNLVS